jgi:glycosyltransferase involved in cell wall biosynthesis
MTISLCMIVKDEEAMLGRCLESVRDVVDEMVIVDTGSTDRTVKIAESYGARVFTYPWGDSFSDARNYGIARATMDWIFIMDADDEFEKQDSGMLRDMTSENAVATAYYCKTLSFMGDEPDLANVVSNLNIYLFRNRMGYRFTGDIHEQISCADPSAKTVTAISDMRVYHYGYLNNAMRSQKKRARNMQLIQKELEKCPDNPFMLYNLGNEYIALRNVRDAYDCYLKSYAHMDPAVAYSSKLILRLVTCCELLGNTAEQMKFINEGLAHYPKFTDLEFIRGTLWMQKERYLAAIRSFKKCLSMGDPPLMLSHVAGVGTYRAAHMLFQIYHNLGNPQSALYYAYLSLRLNPGYSDVLNRLAALLMESMPPEAAAKRMMRRLPPGPKRYLLLSDAFYEHRRWEIALEFARKAARKGCDTDTAVYDQGACLFHMKRYREARGFLSRLAGTAYESRAAFLERLCDYFDGSAASCLPRGDDKYFSVLERFEALMANQCCAPLAASQASSEPYIAPIFGLLVTCSRAILTHTKGSRLQNLVTDDTEQMRLGKLYSATGYLKLAYRESGTSNKLTGKTDAEALHKMKYILEPTWRTARRRTDASSRA